jgi:hypothetical protein
MDTTSEKSNAMKHIWVYIWIGLASIFGLVLYYPSAFSGIFNSVMEPSADVVAHQSTESPESSRIEMGKRMIASELNNPPGLTFGRIIEANAFTVDDQGDNHQGKAICYEVSGPDMKGWAALSPANHLYLTGGNDSMSEGDAGWHRFCAVDWERNRMQ